MGVLGNHPYNKKSFGGSVARFSDSAGCIAGAAWIGAWGACVAGWVLNIVRIFAMVDMPITGMFILRCVGVIVFPLGAILGLFF